jgi:hypothetical protein
MEGGAGRLKTWHDVKLSNDTYITRELKMKEGMISSAIDRITREGFLRM